MQELGDPFPRMFVLGSIVVRQHSCAHVPLELIQRQVPPLRTSGEPPVLVQRDAASVSEVSELMDDEGGPPLEVLDEALERIAPARKEVRTVLGRRLMRAALVGPLRV